MKNLKLKWLLLSIVLSITSFTTPTWAWYTINNATILYDDSKSGWNSNVVIALEKWENWANNNGHGCAVFSMGTGPVTNTKVWYWHGSWGDGGVNVIRFGSTTSTYDWYAWWSSGGTTIDDTYDLAESDGWAGYSGTWAGSISSAAKMFGANSSSKAAALTKTDLSSYSNLNNTITIKAKVSTNGGSSYLDANTPAAISGSSYVFTAYNSCSGTTGASATLSTGGSSTTFKAGYTATTTLTAPTTDPTGYAFEGWYDSSGNLVGATSSSKTATVRPTANTTYYAYYRKLFKISAGATAVWDLGAQYNDGSDHTISWSNAYLRKDFYGSSATHDALTRLGTTGSQWYKTYASASSYMNSFMLRARNDNTWNAVEQTTNVTSDVSNVTIITNKKSVTYQDGKNKLDWEVVTDGKKGASGRTIYFDDTNTNWGSGKMFFNYGVDFTSSGGYHRKISFATTKVPGTANLWKLMASSSEDTNQGKTNSSGQFDHDIYFQKWYVSKSYGWTNHNPITDTHVEERTAIYTDEIVDNDFTLIPTSGAGSSPKVWTTTKLTGHTHTVTIGIHAHGTITLSYTDESNTAQTPTVNTDVAHTCYVSANASADNGYDYSSMTLGGAAYTPNTSTIITKDTTFAATFTPHRYSITLNAGDHGVAAQSASVDFDATSLYSITHVVADAGYALDGYYDGSTKVLNANGSFAANNVDGYITSGKWSKYDADATLTAKFTPVALTFKSDASTTAWGTSSNWSPACVPTIAHDVTIKSPVVVSSTDAKAKSIKIYNDGGNTNTGKLVINAGQKLVVATSITKTTDGSNSEATTANDLVINSDGTNGVGALVWGSASTSPGAAQVNFFTKSGGKKGQNTSVNQFIGTPFTNETSNWLYNYYNSWVLGVNYSGTTPAFYLLGSGDTMEPFKGYCVIYNGSAGHIYEMTGTLVTNANHTCSSLSYKSGGADNMANENLLANPWLSPIKIAAMGSAFSSDVDATVYIFNSTSASESESGTGNYTPHTPGTAGSNVIPAMQSFSVFTKGASGSVTLDYSNLVYNPAIGGINPIANKAPRRAEEEANKLRLFVDAEGGYGDLVYMWERSDFSEGFENGWDARKIYGDKEAPQLYALTPDGNMSINCVPEFEGTVMGFKAGTEDNTYTFSFEYSEEEAPLYLYDVDTQEYTRVVEGNTYTFTTTDTDAHNRFLLTRKVPGVITGVDNGEWANGEGTKAVKFIKDGRLLILRDGKVYNTIGSVE